MAEKIVITPIALLNQKPTDIKECFLELYDTYLRYKIEFYADEPKNLEDHDLGWNVGVYNYYDIIALKNKVSGLQKFYTENKKWAVYIIVEGFGGDIKIYHRTAEVAEKLLNQLKEWLLK